RLVYVVVAAGALEYPRWQRRVVDTHAAAADLRAVEDQVVGLGADAARIGFELVDVFIARRRERMMHRVPASVLGVVLEERKLGDPEELEGVRVQQILFLRDRQP